MLRRKTYLHLNPWYLLSRTMKSVEMKLDSCINFKIQGFCCWVMESKNSFFVFSSCVMQNLAYGLLCFALFFKTLDSECNQTYTWTSAAVSFFQMAGACVYLRVKTIIRFVVRRYQSAVNQTGKFTERCCHFPSNTGRIYR